MSLKNLRSSLLMYGWIIFSGICSCQPGNRKQNNTDASVAQQVMPKDTLLQRLSLAVNSLANSNWDSTSIVQIFAATPDRFYLSVSSNKADSISKTTVIIKPEDKFPNQFRLHINMPDTLANQISYNDLNKLFGEPVQDSLGGIPITPPIEPIISYRIIKGKDTVNLVTYHTTQANSEQENIYSFFIYK